MLYQKSVLFGVVVLVRASERLQYVDLNGLTVDYKTSLFQFHWAINDWTNFKLVRAETRAENMRYGPPLRTFAIRMNWAQLETTRTLRPGLSAKCPPWPKILFKTPLELFKEKRPGARFPKVPKLFGSISGDILVFVSSDRRRLEPRSLAVNFCFGIWKDIQTYEQHMKRHIYQYEKTSFTELAGRSFANGFSQRSRNRPLDCS